MPQATYMEILQPEECRQLLSRRAWGRIAVLVDDHPEVFPVNYIVDGDAILFRTGAGTKLHHASMWPSVAFEIDDADPFGHVGWSVMVVGKASEITDANDLARCWRLPLSPWAFGDTSRWMRIAITTMTGRRIGTATTAYGR